MLRRFISLLVVFIQFLNVAYKWNRYSKLYHNLIFVCWSKLPNTTTHQPVDIVYFTPLTSDLTADLTSDLTRHDLRIPQPPNTSTYKLTLRTAYFSSFTQTLQNLREHLSLLNIACAVKARKRTVVVSRNSRKEVLQFNVLGGLERGSAIFVSKVESNSRAQQAGLNRGDQVNIPSTPYAIY